MSDKQQTLKESVPGLAHMLAYCRPYLRAHRVLLASSGLALFAEVAFRALEPWPLKFIFDAVFRKNTQQTILDAYVRSLGSDQILLLCCVALVVITALRSCAAYWSTLGFAIAGNRVMAEVRNDLYRHLQKLSLSFHTKARSGDLILRVMNDVNMIRDVTVTAALPFVANLLVLATMILIMAWLNLQLAMLAVLTLPLFWLFSFRFSFRIREAARRQRKQQGAMAATAAEALSSIRIIQAFCLEREFAAAFTSQNKGSLRDDMRTTRLSARLERSVDLLIAATTAIVLWKGTTLVTAGSVTPGDLLVFLTYLKRAFNPVQDYAKYSARLAKAAAAGERVLDLLRHSPDVLERPSSVQTAPVRGDVVFRNVTFGYDPHLMVLADLNFHLHPGQRIALVGPSGIGKSTVVNLLLRFYDPLFGCIEIDGRDIRNYRLESLRSQITVVLQDTVLFAVPIWANIAYGCPGASRREIEEAACIANADEFIRYLPEGYETVPGERGVTLSAGQRQRIAIARAAIRHAPIVLLDEPTNGLDEENEAAVVDALDQLCAGRTTILITHDLSLAARADQILYLEQGRVLEKGTHQQLLKNKGRYAMLYKLHSSNLRSLFLGDPDSFLH